MIFRNRITKVKLVEQLTLVTLQTAHHGSTSPRIASTQRNHGSPTASTDFCNKICHEETHAPQQTAALLNDLGLGEERRWNINAERLGGLEVDDQLEGRRLLDRQIGGLGAPGGLFPLKARQGESRKGGFRRVCSV